MYLYALQPKVTRIPNKIHEILCYLEGYWVHFSILTTLKSYHLVFVSQTVILYETHKNNKTNLYILAIILFF